VGQADGDEMGGGAPIANFCSSCGHELREGEKFCAECGTPVDESAPQTQPPPQPITYETCEIDVHYLNGTFFSTQWRGVFMAKAVGPEGIYSAGYSTMHLTGGYINITFERTFDNMEKAQRAVNGLVQHLVTTGWEPTVNGPEWWQYRFQRPVRR
jgi:hypothetical protein